MSDFSIFNFQLSILYMKRLLIIVTFMLLGRMAFAQWSVGVHGGIGFTSIDRSQAGRIDETYNPLMGYDFGIMGSYALNSWFAIRADLGMMQRNHRMQRHLYYLSPVYTDHLNTYLTLPVMADFSFGGSRLRGHLLFGAFAGYWMNQRVKGVTYGMTDYEVFFNEFDTPKDFSSTDRRLNAGLVGGTALSYSLNNSFDLSLNALLYYDLVSHYICYAALQDYRYLNTAAVTLGLSYHIPYNQNQ